MSDRVRTLTVTLNEDTRVGDIEGVVAAIRMLRPVADVTLGRVEDLDAHYARIDARRQLRDALWAFMRGEGPK